MREFEKCCAWGPDEVRNLAAVAHNAHGAVTAALSGTGDWSRARRKLAELGRTLDSTRPARDAHFDERHHEIARTSGPPDWHPV